MNISYVAIIVNDENILFDLDLAKDVKLSKREQNLTQSALLRQLLLIHDVSLT